MTITKPFTTEGTGTIIPSSRPGSRVQSLTGIIAPTQPGSTPIIEPWKALLVSAARLVPTEDMQIVQMGFTVAYAAGSNDQCDLGILDLFGDVLYHTGLTAGHLNTAGDQFMTIPAFTLNAGQGYYSAFGYGTVGSTPAVLKCSNFAQVPENSGHLTGFGQSSYGYQDTVQWSTASGAIGAPSGYADFGQAVTLVLREW